LDAPENFITDPLAVGFLYQSLVMSGEGRNPIYNGDKWFTFLNTNSCTFIHSKPKFLWP
jgi:hypothetical protein